MKFLPTLIAAAMAALLLASPARATLQPKDHPGSLAILLGNDSVRADLKLRSLQRAVLDSLRSDYRADARAIVAKVAKKELDATSAFAKLSALTDHYDARALSTLNPEQRTRLRQIEQQILGGAILVSPDIQKSLALTDPQKAKIEKIRVKGLEAVDKVNHRYDAGKISLNERLLELKDHRKDTADAMLKVLTKEQRAAFVAAEGKKFTF